MTYTPHQPGQCEWIEPYPLESLIRCSHPHSQGSTYCEEHALKMGPNGTALRRRHKDIRRANAVWTLESDFHDVVAELEAEGVDFD